ncbi:hypothetical protein [Streptomyces sp. NPDC087437]|uniref:hypothetical protein n=1 Tax=Streptomyces sp. NPDC087437 TaxID=3365789 RepID=UPI00380BF9DB
MPFALIAVIALADALTAPYVQLGPLLMAAPAVSAAFAGPRLTALVSVLAVGSRLAVASLQHTVGDASRNGGSPRWPPARSWWSSSRPYATGTGAC